MLKEIRNVRQERGAGPRRWFESDGLDLVVWHDTAGAFTGFQICYDLGQGEHALTWRTNSSFAHSTVDSGDETPFKNETPVLVNDGVVPWAEVTARFDAESASLDPKLRELVLTRLRAHK
jgi:hypothetical protein